MRFHDVIQKDLYDALSSFEEDKPIRDAAQFLSAISQRVRLEREPGYDGVGPKHSEEELGKMAKKNDLHGAAAGAKSYNSRSGQILGVLGGLSDAFKGDLGQAQKEELEALINFQHLSAAKRSEIAVASQAKEEKESALADLGVKVYRSKDQLGETKDFLAQSENFLVDLGKMCKEAEGEYQARVKVRTEEIRALGEVLKILTDDAARDLYAKTMSFLQFNMDKYSTGEQMQRRAMDRAVQRVLGVARKHKDWMLISLMTRARLDNFSKVKALMDKMVAELQAQQKAEYDKKALCGKQLDDADDHINHQTKVKNELETSKLGFENTITALENEIAQLHQDIADTQVSLKQAGEDRKAENELFQSSVADQRTTVQILKKAQTRMEQFYLESSMLQAKVTPAHMAGSDTSKEYRKGANSGAIMQLLAKIISEAEQAEATLVIDEQHAQANYASFAADATATVENNRATIASDEKAKATAEGALSETKEALLANGAELSRLDDLLGSIHAECDFLLKFFDLRQKSRKEEMDSITDAKAILSGASYGS